LPASDGRAALELGARPIRNDFFPLDAATHALVLELRIQVGKLDRQQIVGRRVERDRELRCARARAGEQRFVVACHQAGIAAVLGGNAVWAKMRGEERAHRVGIRAVDTRAFSARFLPHRLGFRIGEQCAATNDERGPCAATGSAAKPGRSVHAAGVNTARDDVDGAGGVTIGAGLGGGTVWQPVTAMPAAIATAATADARRDQ
jgi:hypothetical protein